MSDAASDRLGRLATETAAAADGPAWLGDLRTAAAGHFAEQGLPHGKLEEWRYTSTRPLTAHEFALSTPCAEGVDRAALEALSFPVYACSLYVFVNGFFAPELSAPKALSGRVRAESLAVSPAEGLGQLVDTKLHPLAALNTACFRDGARLVIPAGIRLEQPIHVVFLANGSPTEPATSFPRLFVDAGAGSHARVIVDYVSLGEGPHWTNSVAEATLGANAELEVAIVQREQREVVHSSLVAARLDRDSRLSAHTLTLGGAWVRNDLSIQLAEPGAECHLNGLFLGTGERLVDNHSMVDHAVPHCSSHQLYKGVLDDRSRGVFRGRVLVRPDAQKTDAQQSNPNLILGDGAEVDTKPQLEIHADDVKCSHGSTIGRLDDDALFYLRARGLAEPAARRLLTRAFAGEILDRIGEPALAESLGQLLQERLHLDDAPGAQT
ncbi:MAG: Fe-S cluster assembly protein SufD [Myxococcales bacterium]|nr:Fe-S cluster assembly protein SufD [Myxococcales bacterium]